MTNQVSKQQRDQQLLQKMLLTPITQQKLRNRRHVFLPLWVILITISLIIFIVMFLIMQFIKEINIEIILIAVLLLVPLMICAGYVFKWRWTGLTSYTYLKSDKEEIYKGKTLWDWMQLLIIPAVLATGGLLFNTRNEKIQEAITLDNQREVALQDYFDKMSELMLDKNLISSASSDQQRNVARIRTLSTLRTLDGRRKNEVIQFLQESHLIDKNTRVISLANADLSSVDFHGVTIEDIDLDAVDLHSSDFRDIYIDNTAIDLAYLNNSDLSNAFLKDVRFIGSNFTGAKLLRTYFTNIDFSGGDFTDADLSGSNLNNTIFTRAKLKNTNFYDTFLHNVDFTNVDLTNIDLTKSTLDNVIWDNTICPDGTNADTHNNTCLNNLSFKISRDILSSFWH